MQGQDSSSPPLVKLLDFGLAKATQQPSANGLIGSMAKTFVGTPSYLAPEVTGLGSYGVAVDNWSLGAVLFVMLVARFPGVSSFQGVLASYIIISIP